MSRFRHDDQPDMFAVLEGEAKPERYIYEDYMQVIRRPQLQAKLRLAQEATVFPWKNLTDATSEEMQFNDMARNFPDEEGRPAMEAYAREIVRLYALIDEPWTPLLYSCAGRWG